MCKTAHAIYITTRNKELWTSGTAHWKLSKFNWKKTKLILSSNFNHLLRKQSYASKADIFVCKYDSTYLSWLKTRSFCLNNLPDSQGGSSWNARAPGEGWVALPLHLPALMSSSEASPSGVSHSGRRWVVWKRVSPCTNTNSMKTGSLLDLLSLVNSSYSLWPCLAKNKSAAVITFLSWYQQHTWLNHCQGGTELNLFWVLFQKPKQSTRGRRNLSLPTVTEGWGTDTPKEVHCP